MPFDIKVIVWHTVAYKRQIQNTFSHRAGVRMRLASLQRIELRHYFEIKRDLAFAVRDSAVDNVNHHLDELQILGMHTESEKLRSACKATVAGHAVPAAAA